MSEPENFDKPQRKKLNAANLEVSIDQQIREAMERGDFDNCEARASRSTSREIQTCPKIGN